MTLYDALSGGRSGVASSESGRAGGRPVVREHEEDRAVGLEDQRLRRMQHHRHNVRELQLVVDGEQPSVQLHVLGQKVQWALQEKKQWTYLRDRSTEWPPAGKETCSQSSSIHSLSPSSFVVL